MSMNLEQRIEFARRERRKASAYEPEQVPGKGRFGKPTKGTNYLPEKSQYVDALGFYIDRAKAGGGASAELAAGPVWLDVPRFAVDGSNPGRAGGGEVG